jgi:hypothetical protein
MISELELGNHKRARTLDKKRFQRPSFFALVFSSSMIGGIVFHRFFGSSEICCS